MGIIGKILSAFGLGKDTEHHTGTTESVARVTNMDEDNGNTLIFTGEPAMDTAIGMNGEQRMSPSMIVANSQINNDQKIGPMVGARSRGARSPQNAPMQQPMQPAPQPMQQMPQYRQPTMSPVQQQQPYVNPYSPQQQQYQQPYGYPQYPAQQYQPEIETDEPVNEPYYQMILVNDVYHFYVDLPGVKKPLSVRYVNGEIEIKGTRANMADVWKSKLRGNKGKKPVFESQTTVPDYLMGKFEFKFYFPLPVDETTVRGELEDCGILHVSMSLRASSGGVTVDIA